MKDLHFSWSGRCTMVSICTNDMMVLGSNPVTDVPVSRHNDFVVFLCEKGNFL